MEDETTDSQTSSDARLARGAKKVSWIRGLARRLALLGIGSFVGLVIAEGLLRLLGVGAFLAYHPDPYCGVRLRANLKGNYRQEGRGYVSINSDGNRDVERETAKREGVYRIAVIGDSYAEALQVDRDEAFWAVLENLANARKRENQQRIEVLNFGVSGYGTAQELLMLKHYVWKYEPDVVVLAFLTGNDLMDNSPDIGPEQPRPYYRLVDGELQLDNSFLQHPTYLHATKRTTQGKVWLINQSRVLQVINHIKTAWEQAQVSDEQRLTLDELGLDWRVYREPVDEEWREAWHVTAELIAEFARECREHRAEPAVVCLSNAIQVDPDLGRRRDFLQQHEIVDLYFPDRRIAEICEENELPCLLLAPQMAEAAAQDGSYFHGFANTELGSGHWNRDGHRFAGEVVTDWLDQLELLGSPSSDD